jgi:16S rRNA (cytosine967-C5)-methyltransferase
MDGIPEYAAVNETVNLAIGNGFFHQRNFINAILRNVIRSKKYLASDIPQTNSVEYSGIKYSHPDWIVELYSRQFGKENTQQLLEFNNTIAPLFLCINTLKIKLEEYFQLLNSKNIAYTVSPYSPAIITLQEHIPPREIPGYAEGYFYIQDLAAALIAMSISPRPGTKVLDACAAPGGKSLLMAMSMQNKGSLYALDIHVNRLTLLKENQERLGLDIIQIHKGDTSTGLVSSLPEKYDYILIDAPCSGLGVLRKKVDARWNKQPEDLPGLVGLQSLLLNNLALYLEKNGVLVYSTCTLNPQENQKQIIKFLSKNPQFEVESLRNILPISAHSSITPEGYLLTLPFRDHLDGMFACRMKRRT